MEGEVGLLWGNQVFEWISQPSIGLSAGLLCSIHSTFSGVGFLGVRINMLNMVVYVINVYAPQSPSAKRRVWEDLLNIKRSNSHGEWCIVGDFNAVSCVEERKGRSGVSSAREIADFNNFIAYMELIDVPVSGKKNS